VGSLVGQAVCIKLKWGQEYCGLLTSFDSYQNFQLSSTQEWIDGEMKGELGEVMIRCNNVLYVREMPKAL
jgi:small nuclear ribonucleoprotein F